MISNKQNIKKKIKYRSQYRGSKEMDIFLSSFVNSIINDLNFRDLEQLNILVNLNDEDIVKISLGHLKVDVSNKIINLLIDFKKK